MQSARTAGNSAEKSHESAAFCHSQESLSSAEDSSPPGRQKKGRVKISRSLAKKGKGSPYSITERRVPELIPVLGSQPAGDVSQKPDGRLPLLSARPAVTLATLKRAATNFAAW